MAQPDLTAEVNNDMAMTPDAGEDMTAAEPATAQITVADVVGIAYAPFQDGGVPIGFPTVPTGVPVHSLAVVVDFPAAAGTSQHSSGTALNGCTWNRYNTAMGPFPAPNENAGSVSITGYDTSNTLAVDSLQIKATAPPPATVNCVYNPMTFHFDCHYGTSAADDVTRYIFPLTPNPSPSPSPAPQFFNSDLFINANSVTEAFTPSPAPSTYTDARMTTLTALPKAPHVITINGTASTNELESLAGKIDGSADVVIEYSCDGSANKGAGCMIGGITGLLIQTSLGKPWQPASGANLLRFGTAQCVDTDNGMAAHQFTLTKQMQMDILGSDTGQTVRVVLVRLKANATTSGMHSFYETAGRGIYSFITQ